MGTTRNNAADDDRRAHDPNWEDRDDHPVGTTTGTGTGATAGAVAGMAVAGPPGAVAGAVIGGVAGGLAGHGIADAVNPDGDDVDGDVIPDPTNVDDRIKDGVTGDHFAGDAIDDERGWTTTSASPAGTRDVGTGSGAVAMDETGGPGKY